MLTTTITLLVLAGLVGLLGLVTVVVLGVKHSPVAARLSAVWAAYAGMYIYMLSQSDFSALNMIALAVIGATQIYLALESEVELLN